MKVALVTTTINVPTALKWYRACSVHTPFFIATDKKTPTDAKFDEALPVNTFVFPPYSQEKWKCSELIGWNSIQRRNIAFLEAAKTGADVIVSCDDDNLPIDASYFDMFRRLFSFPFNGLSAKATTGFFDIGDFLFPKSKQRGIPFNNRAGLEIGSVLDARIGVAQGLCIGAPDIDAATRYHNGDAVHQVSEIARAGIVVDPSSNTIWNSQNTAIRRELLPAWGMIPHVGRMDDIYASVICHRVMREHGYHVHYGLPMVYQQRNPHNLIQDMRKEIDGYEIVDQLAAVLDHVQLRGASIIDDCRRIWETIGAGKLLPAASVEAMTAYIDDCETVL